MKKLLLLLTFLAPSVALLAQTEKGTFVVSGATNFNFSNSEQEFGVNNREVNQCNITAYSFMPSIGYFVIDNLSIGISCNISEKTEEYKNDNETKQSILSLMPSATYLFPINGPIKPFLQVGFGYSSLTQKHYNTINDSYEGYSFGLGGGFSYFINKSVSVDLGLQYTYSALDDNENAIHQNAIGGNVGFSFYF